MKSFLLLLTIFLTSSLVSCLSVELPDTITWKGKKYFESGHYPLGMDGLTKTGSQNGYSIYEYPGMFEDSIFIKTDDGFLEYVWEFKPQLMKKPNIYLYPQSETDVKVSVKFKGKITVNDPPYNNGWCVTAKPDGTLTNIADEKKYSYLFREGECCCNFKDRRECHIEPD